MKNHHLVGIDLSFFPTTKQTNLRKNMQIVMEQLVLSRKNGHGKKTASNSATQNIEQMVERSHDNISNFPKSTLPFLVNLWNRTLYP